MTKKQRVKKPTRARPVPQERWDEARRRSQSWLQEEQTAQYSDDEIKACTRKWCDKLGIKPRAIWVVDSPLQAKLIAGMTAPDEFGESLVSKVIGEYVSTQTDIMTSTETDDFVSAWTQSGEDLMEPLAAARNRCFGDISLVHAAFCNGLQTLKDLCGQIVIDQIKALSSTSFSRSMNLWMSTKVQIYDDIVDLHSGNRLAESDISVPKLSSDLSDVVRQVYSVAMDDYGKNQLSAYDRLLLSLDGTLFTMGEGYAHYGVLLAAMEDCYSSLHSSLGDIYDRYATIVYETASAEELAKSYESSLDVVIESVEPLSDVVFEPEIKRCLTDSEDKLLSIAEHSIRRVEDAFVVALGHTECDTRVSGGGGSAELCEANVLRETAMGCFEIHVTCDWQSTSSNPTVSLDKPVIRSLLAKHLRDIPEVELEFYCGLWWNSRAAWFEAANIVGIPPTKDMEEFVEWNRLCPVWIWSNQDIFILRRPKTIKWSEDGTGVHNEEGPAVFYSEDFKLWAIDGIGVDEQIVMRPETQTIEQINKESNEEVRRIRIERFGVMRYVEESNCEIIDSRRNDVENTYEVLVNTSFGQRLLTHCPSTGRRYFLSLPEEVSTCEQAQSLLWGVKCNIIGRT